MKCDCGSGLESEPEYDARDIYLCRACSKCRRDSFPDIAAMSSPIPTTKQMNP